MKDGKFYATKIISLENIRNDEKKKTKEIEIKVHKKLKHPNLLRLYHVFKKEK